VIGPDRELQGSRPLRQGQWAVRIPAGQGGGACAGGSALVKVFGPVGLYEVMKWRRQQGTVCLHTYAPGREAAGG
jgi:hypothetical protein